jgi:replication factor C subunit 3/5
MKNHAPWVEKYRPTKLSNVVLDSTNKKILNNIIENNYFPNLLFYGPPGTGKTTTIINLINRYQEKYHQKKKELKIHLNASDDRGIDIIRNQIYQFVNTKTFFSGGLKFVILDEVDYMTKNAQQALRYLIQQYSDNIRFCLICNYISRIDNSLQNEFVRLRFCQLPSTSIYKFLDTIQEKEKLNISKAHLSSIILLFKSDIRSMINFLQSNHESLISGKNINYIITGEIWDNIITQISQSKNTEKINNIVKQYAIQYNMGNKCFVKELLIHIINTNDKLATPTQLMKFKYIIHNLDTNEQYLLNYFFNEMRLLDNV